MRVAAMNRCEHDLTQYFQLTEQWVHYISC